MPKTYPVTCDEKCYDLASAFLEDEWMHKDLIADREKAHTLARQLQKKDREQRAAESN